MNANIAIVYIQCCGLAVNLKQLAEGKDDVNYSHVICNKCWGIVRLANNMEFICEKCGNQIALRSYDYDILVTNDKTGWIYPMLDNNNLKG